MQTEDVGKLAIKLDYAIQDITKLKNQVDDLRKIYTSIELLAQELKFLREDTNCIDERLCNIETQPAKKWETVTMDIIKLLIAGIIGFVMNIVFRKGGV